MRKAIMLAVILLAAASSARAQEEYPRVDIFGGYSYFSSDQFVERENLGSPGFIVSVAGNFTRSVGLVGEISGHYGTVSLAEVGILQRDANVHNFLFGPRFTARRENFDAFGHVLFGGSRAKLEGADAETDFALAVGGGLDINVSEFIDVRLIQLDYLPAFSDGRTAHNFRASIGLVFRFNQK